MKIAVLMSTYNGEKYIKEQIDSILRQKCDMEIDLWIRDDGSVDNTQKILDTYKNKGKLNWYAGVNIGPAQSFINLLLHCEKYDFYAFADQDDYWMSDKLQQGINRIKNIDNAALYISNARLVNSARIYMGRNVYKKTPKLDFYTLSCAGGLLGCTMIFNHALAAIVQNNILPDDIIMHDFYIALVCASMNGSLIYDPVPHMDYRQHENNVVGVSYGMKQILTSRISDMIRKPKISIANQANSLLKISGISAKNRDWLIKVNNYRETFYSRLKLAFSLKTRYINWNMGIKLRISIFFGNR